MEPEILGEKLLCAGKFLNFCDVTYRDPKGVTRIWESVDRRDGTRRGANLPSAVFIVAHIVPDDEILLVRQFRPPSGRRIIEFPAGLIDPGETPEQAAVRELAEETGYAGKVLFLTAPGYSSPGLTGESLVLAAMEIDGNAYRSAPPEAHPEECESIEVLRVPLARLEEFLHREECSGCGIDSKLYTWCAMKRLGC